MRVKLVGRTAFSVMAGPRPGYLYQHKWLRVDDSAAIGGPP
jgi:hypothetical protein